MVPLVAAAGFQWMATDEVILARTLGIDVLAATPRATSSSPSGSTRRTSSRAGGAQVACAFRDHALSDLIGFTYAGWTADAAADDFVGRLVEAGPPLPRRDRRGRGDHLVILDGENAWEHFEGGGRPFLRALYGRLSAHPELRTVTMAEACAAPASDADGIFPGSWINANFYIWIGHARRPAGLEPAGRGARRRSTTRRRRCRRDARARPARSC